MKLPLYWVDAFASRVFEGNPAAVVPLSSWLSDSIMQHIAFENGLAETAFFVHADRERSQVRWFTPRQEVDLCGHATLASAHVLFTQLNHGSDAITFDSRGGPLVVTRQSERYQLDFPSRPAVLLRNSSAIELIESLGLSPSELHSVMPGRYLAVYEKAGDVLSLKPDFSRLSSLGDVRVIATAPGQDCDFVSRFFAPGIGVPEDSVTGSAHCTLVPYWARRLGKNQLHARQVSARGGELWCESHGDRVKMSGHAVLYLRGEIEI